MDDSRKIYTLTELGKSIRSVIERTYTSTYWIKAEIAKLNFYPRSGHCYPELVDKTGNVIQAQMRSTIWAADYKQITKKFTEIAGEPLKEGMSILFRASVGFHPVHGLSLQIWDIEPSFTVGEMALAKTRNIEKLQSEGVFDLNRTRPMPLLPLRIAVISVETSKGYHDFMQILRQQAQGYAWWHFLFPSVLQGDKAIEGILSQLRIIKKAHGRFDLVAIIRGGGGDIGLNCYDDYQLAREIATFPIPVITGIGHATNVTIAEMVAWENKITPTDVAYFIVDRFKSFEVRINNAAGSLSGRLTSVLSYARQNIDHFSSRLARHPLYIISGQKTRLSNLTSSVLSATGAMQQKHRDVLGQKALKLSVLTPGITRKHTNHLDTLETKLTLLNPENILKRGYSITTFSGGILKDVATVKQGDRITTHLQDGSVDSIID